MIALSSSFDRLNSYHDLKEKHLFAAANVQQWQEVWTVVCKHPYFSMKLTQCANKVIRKARLNRSEIDDIKQHALLEIAAAIQRQPSLGFDERSGNYAAFLSTIVYRACLKALRQFSGEPSWQFPEDLMHPSYDDQGQRERVLDFQHIAAQLPTPYREIIQQLCDGASIEELACLHDRSTRTIYRMVERSIELMQLLYFRHN